MAKVLDNLESLLAILMVAGCTVSLSSIGIGPLVFIIIAIIRLVGSKSLGERAKLLNTVLTASILGAVAHIVSASIVPSLAQQIYGTSLFSVPSSVPEPIGSLMLAGPAFISGLVVGALVAYRYRRHVVLAALGAASVATYIALGWEGWFYWILTDRYFLIDDDLQFLGWFTSSLCSVVQFMVAGLGAILCGFLIGRHRLNEAPNDAT